MKKKLLSISLLFLLSIVSVRGQFTLDGEFRPRTEYRHGYGNLIADSVEAGFAISTRLRLNAAYAIDSYQFYVSLQDVMVWGENRQLKPEDDNNSFSIFEAWAKIDLGENFSAKIGRQQLVYDDQRIFGGVDWTQQARNHDALLIKHRKNNFQVDLGLAFNQDFNNTSGFQSVGTSYTTTGFFSYKTMQYLYGKQAWTNLSTSILFLNNGFQNFDANNNADGTSNLQTLGIHLNYKKGSFATALNAFSQMGKRQNNIAVGGAYLLGLDASYTASDKLGLGLGAELISGNKTETADKTEAFFPLFGTNHKFNGFMDYFYVGNHANSVGLFDVHVSADFAIGKKSGLMIKALNFNAAQPLPSGGKSLGTEVDIVFSQVFKGYALKIGYSQMFASDGLYELKNVPESIAAGSQNWAWAMLVIKPEFLNTSKE